MADNNSTSVPSAAPSVSATRLKSRSREKSIITGLCNAIVLLLSVVLIVWISLDTFNDVDFLNSTPYMTFQLWVCVFFIIDFFVELAFAPDRWRYFRRRIVFLLLSVPYLNIISLLDISLGDSALYFVRFIPLARGALAMSIVIGYLSSNAISSLFLSYIVIMVMVTYFCSLIFFQEEYGVNPQVNTYWTALWWAAMKVTVVGKAVCVVLPVVGMVIFPLFTVYLTDYVSRQVRKGHERADGHFDATDSDSQSSAS